MFKDAGHVDGYLVLKLKMERYEGTHCRIPVAGAVSVVRFLLQHYGLTQRDLIPQFGTAAAG
jgi:antitoxin component HigA of HigAB toxin-antitoxin module